MEKNQNGMSKKHQNGFDVTIVFQTEFRKMGLGPSRKCCASSDGIGEPGPEPTSGWCWASSASGGRTRSDGPILATGHCLWLHFGVDEHPFATYFDVHRGCRVLTHSQLGADRG